MTVNTHLTNDLQVELKRLGSPILLQTHNSSVIKLNYKEWAWADINSRQIEASTFVGLNDKHLQLEEKRILACTASTKDIAEIAIIIDKWLAKRLEGFQLADEHSSIKINERYQNLKTFPVDELLKIRWTHLAEEIAKGRIDFRKEIFDKFRERFSYLFPFFSHNNLWFSNVLELPNNFKTPFIFCRNEVIEIGSKLGNSKANDYFKTRDVEEAVRTTQKLLPEHRRDTVNPLTT